MPSGTQVDKSIMDSIYDVIQKYCVLIGYTPDLTLYQVGQVNFNNTTQYKSDIQAIVNTKGYSIKIFSQSSARYKGKTDAPRIVIFQSRTLPGEVGAPAGVITSQDKNDATKYQSGFVVPQAMSMIIAIHLISANSQQHYILNQVLGATINQRAYIPFRDKPDESFFIYQSSFSDLDDPLENIIEKAYFYTVPDVFLGEMDVIRSNFNPIQQITTNISIDNLPAQESDKIEVEEP